jgi:hypothetical protein
MRLNGAVDGPRACRDHELPMVLDLTNLVMRVDAGRPPTYGHDWPHVYSPANLANVRVLFRDGELASSIAIFPTTARVAAAELRVGGINGVVTHPELRNQSAAGLVLRDCHRKMLEDGCDLALLSTVIVDWYRRFGWELGALQQTFVLDRNTIRYLPTIPDLEVAVAGAADRAALRALHEREPLGARRAAELWPILLGRPLVTAYVARQRDRVVAYAVVSGDAVIESGGPGGLAAVLVAELYRRRDDPAVSTSTYERGRAPRLPTLRLRVHLPPGDDGLGAYLQRLGVPGQLDYLGMIRILNARQLLGKLAPRVVVEREEEDAVTLRDGAEVLTLSRRDLVKLCLGPERITAFASDVLPAPFFQFPLDRT